ncbi:MAG: polymer-forming cytoskeletal protein [Desulfitobacterium sp.]|nr:polymer-forming cytoskeletal protein [Desulfitobacterium sp.]
MWGKSDKSKKSLPENSGETTYLASDAEFEGKLTLKGSARIDGKVRGQIQLEGDLVIGPSAFVNASIRANSVSISGEVRGDIITQETLELRSSAKLTGNIYTQELKIDQGARFLGTSHLLEDAEKANLDGDIPVEEILKPLEPLEDEKDPESEKDAESEEEKNPPSNKGRSRRR